MRCLRVLAIAYKHIERFQSSDPAEIESGLTFIGLVGMIDPARPEAAGNRWHYVNRLDKAGDDNR